MTEKTPFNWKKWLLIVSLALNFCVVGLVAGLAIRGPHPEKLEMVRDAQYGLVPAMIAAVPKKHHKKLRSELKATRSTIRAQSQRLRTIRTEFATALEAEDFSIDTVRALFDEHNALGRGISERGQSILITQIEEMSPMDRAVFAENIRKIRDRRRNGKPPKPRPKTP